MTYSMWVTQQFVLQIRWFIVKVLTPETSIEDENGQAFCHSERISHESQQARLLTERAGVVLINFISHIQQPKDMDKLKKN